MSEQDKKQQQLDTLKGLMGNANYARGVGEIKNDLWQDIKSGIVAVPQAGVGLLNLWSGGHAGKLVEDNIWDMQKTQESIHAQKSATAHAQERQFDNAEGFGAKLGTIVKNPTLAMDAAVQSLPLMYAGGVAGRGIGRVAGIKNTALRAGIGEGTVMAGSASENMRSQNDDGLLTGKETLASIATGVAGGLFGYGGSKLAGKLGIGDIDMVAAGGLSELRRAGQNTAKGGLANGLKGIGKGAVSEGVFEELPQTLAETALDNWANGRALSENMAGNAAMGLAAGATMGGVVGGLSSKWTKDNLPQDNPNPSTPQLGYNPNPVAPTGGSEPPSPNSGTVIDENGKILSSSAEQSTLPQAVYTLANAINDYQGVDEPSVSLAQNLLTHIGQNGIDVQALTDSTDKQEALAQVLTNADPSVFASADSFGQFVAQNDYINQFRVDNNTQIGNEAVTTKQAQIPTANDRADEARRGIDPSFGKRLQTPSEKLGLDPNAGALSKSAVVAVNSGASAIGQALHAQAKQNAQEPHASQDNNEQAQSFIDTPKIIGKQNYIQNQNERLPTQLMVVEADTLSPSTDNTQNQARDRNRTASRLQVDTIANNLDPAQLTDSTTMMHGSPTITDDGTIIAGNGRTMALKQAYAQGRGEEYRQMLATKADEYGLDKTALAQMKNPVLVKSVGSIHPDKLRQLALNSNETGTMAQSAFEMARADVERVAKVNLDNLYSDDKGNINTPSNRHVINQFVSQFPIEQQNALRQADGTLSKQGLERFENALLLSAYGDNPTTQAILESTDIELKNAIKALASTAPSIAKTKQGIQDGITPNDDIARDITDALSVLAKLRRDNIKPSDYLAQTALFEDELSDTAKRLLDFMDKNIKSVVKIRQLLYKYYDNLSKENLTQDDMFGKPNQSKQTRLNHALQELGYDKPNSEPTTPNNPTDKSTEPSNPSKSAGQSATLNERPQKGESNGQGVGRDDGGVSLTGQEFGGDSLEALRQNAIDYLRTLKGQYVAVPALSGVEKDTNVEIRERGIKHIESYSSDPRKLQILAKIKEILATAEYIYSTDNTKTQKKPDVEKYHYLKNTVELDGKPFEFVIVIEKDQRGLLHYDILTNKYAKIHLDKQKGFDNAIPKKSQGNYQNLDNTISSNSENIKLHLEKTQKNNLGHIIPEKSQGYDQDYGDSLSNQGGTVKPKNALDGLKDKRIQKAQTKADTTLRADWGVERIGNFEATEEFPADLSKENSDPVKEAFLKDIKNYLSIVQSLMEGRGYSLYKNPKGKLEKISINTGGSGEATLVMHKDRVNVFVKVSVSPMRTRDGHPQGVQTLYRAYKGDYKNRYSGGHNHFDNAKLSAGELAQTLDELAQKQIARNKVDFSLAINEKALDNLSDEAAKKVLAMFDDADNQASKDKALTKVDERTKIANLTQEQENAKRPTTVQSPSRVLADTPSNGVGGDTNGGTPSSVHSTSGKPSQSRDTNQPTTGDDRQRSTGVFSDGDKAGLSRGVDADFADYIKNHDSLAKATKAYFDDHLKGKAFDTVIGKVHILGSSWQKKLKAGISNQKVDEIKALAIAFIPDILTNGHYDGLWDNNKERKDAYIGFHSFSKEVQIKSKPTFVRVLVGERENNEFELVVYNLYPNKKSSDHSITLIGESPDNSETISKNTDDVKQDKQNPDIGVSGDLARAVSGFGDSLPNSNKAVNPQTTTKTLDDAIQATNQADFRLSEQMVQTGSVKDKLATNIAIIELLKQLKQENRQPTNDEKALMAKYTGFGGLSKAFADSQGGYAKGFEELGQKLRALMSKEAYENARASATSAFFTPPKVINAMWGVAERLGYNGGVVLEPSAGVGAFIGHAPKNLPQKIIGTEIDPTSHAITNHLYPHANIFNQGYENLALPDNSVDLAIGNPPYGSVKLNFQNKPHLSGKTIANSFMQGTLEQVKPNGLSVMVVSASFMDSTNADTRKQMAELGELVGAIRLPNTTFDEAGTAVVADILVFKKHDETTLQAYKEGSKTDYPAWVQSSKRVSDDGVEVNFNPYFDDKIAGEFSLVQAKEGERFIPLPKPKT